MVSAQVGIIVGPMNLAGSFKTYALYATLLNNVGQALGMLIGCTFKSKEVAMQVRHPILSSLSETRHVPQPWQQRDSRSTSKLNSFLTCVCCCGPLQVMPLAILPVMIFGGLFVNLETIPDAFHWLQYISPIKYSYNAMLLDEFGALTNLTCTVQQQKPDGSCPFDDGEQARSASGF